MNIHLKDGQTGLQQNRRATQYSAGPFLFSLQLFMIMSEITNFILHCDSLNMKYY